MSYVRWGEDGSDVYVFWNSEEQYECCGCSLMGEFPQPPFQTHKAVTMLTHLKKHKKKGDNIPDYIIDIFEQLAIDEWEAGMKVLFGNHMIQFIDKYTTSYNKEKQEWGCDCKHGSINSCKLKKYPCKHIKKAQTLYLKFKSLGVDMDEGSCYSNEFMVKSPIANP